MRTYSLILLALSMSLLPACGNDTDGDGVADGDDCRPEDPSIYPGAVEIPYDRIDQDCDGSDLEDVDGDGFSGHPRTGDDCDDDDAGVFPGATEVPYDGIDQDCDGADLDDIDGDGVPGPPVGNDCDDEDPDRSPRRAEVPYDGIDQDCDGADLVDADRDGFDGEEVGGDDCDDRRASVNPGRSEVPYNDLDDDCVDGDLVDVDGDGFSGHPRTGDDCDDNNPDVRPDAVEICGDGIDNDCDGAPACGFFGERSAVDADAKIWWMGGSTGTTFATGDVNGDGDLDLLIGCPDRGSGGNVFLFEGPITSDQRVEDAVLALEPEANRRETGFDVAILPDQDGDGILELAIGAPNLDGPELTGGWPPVAGAAYIIDGSLRGTRRLTNTGELGKLWGDDEDDQLGYSISAAGDVDGDGQDDLVVGAPDLRGDDAGYGYVFRGGLGRRGPADEEAWLEVQGSAGPSSVKVADYFGRHAIDLGDTDGDGLSDVAFSAVNAFNYKGAAYAILGGGGGGIVRASDSDVTLQGDPTRDFSAYFGKGMDAAGDVNGDGYADLVVGRGTGGYGGAHVFFGPLTSGLSTAQHDLWIDIDPDDVALGENVAGVGDVDGDGKDEVAIAAPRWADYAGAVFLIPGGSTGQIDAMDLPRVVGATANDSLGADYTTTDSRSLRRVGDLNRDGFDDLMVGAVDDDADGTGTGRIYVFFGGPGL